MKRQNTTTPLLPLGYPIRKSFYGKEMTAVKPQYGMCFISNANDPLEWYQYTLRKHAMMLAVQEKVIDKIEKLKEEKSTLLCKDLNLIMLHVAWLPPLGSLANKLTHITISNSMLSTVPFEMRMMVNLMSLKLDGNRFSEVCNPTSLILNYADTRDYLLHKEPPSALDET